MAPTASTHSSSRGGSRPIAPLRPARFRRRRRISSWPSTCGARRVSASGFRHILPGPTRCSPTTSPTSDRRIRSIGWPSPTSPTTALGSCNRPRRVKSGHSFPISPPTWPPCRPPESAGSDSSGPEKVGLSLRVPSQPRVGGVPNEIYYEWLGHRAKISCVPSRHFHPWRGCRCEASEWPVIRRSGDSDGCRRTLSLDSLRPSIRANK